MRIVADSNMCGVEEIFAPLGDVIVHPGRELTASQVCGADLLLVRSVTQVDRALLEGSGVSFVATATSGFDHIDTEYLQASGIHFAYAPGSNANSVLEYVISAIACCDDFLERLSNGGRVGIIGFGVIGRLLAQRLSKLGIAYCAYDPWLEPSVDARLTDLDAVLNCDVVCVHAELTQRQPWPSRHLLDAVRLAQIKPESLLISAGRGAVIDNPALKSLLQKQPERRVILDVWENEPDIDRELMQACVFATPHIAGYSYDGKLLATRMLYASACEALGVELPAGVVADSAAIPLVLPPDRPMAEQFRWLQAQSYDIRHDDRRMRLNAANDFDQQRSQYPRRRELSVCRLANAAELDQAQIALCRNLGVTC